MKSIKYIVIGILIVAICALSAIYTSTKENKIESSANVSSTKKIAWGIKRNDSHEQPDCRKQ
jgi:hypothetical protein